MLHKEWQIVCMSPQAVEAPIYNTFTVYVNMVILSVQGNHLLFTKQIVSVDSRKVGLE